MQCVDQRIGPHALHLQGNTLAMGRHMAHELRDKSWYSASYFDFYHPASMKSLHCTSNLSCLSIAVEHSIPKCSSTFHGLSIFHSPSYEQCRSLIVASTPAPSALPSPHPVRLAGSSSSTSQMSPVPPSTPSPTHPLSSAS